MSDSELAQRRVGTTLQGKWTLEKVLGVGGMASVYLGRHKIGRLDAIKILHMDIAHSALLRKRFEQEASVVNSFKHKGAVEIRDIDVTEDGAPFLVMELLTGESLSQLVHRDGALAPERVLRIADETLDVLAAAHARGIIHRDIKPDNLFIQEDGSVKVLDFGIARLREGSPDRELKTKTGTTLGTASYMAPEQARGIAEIDGRVDLYAVGATMFRVLTNRRVHEADTQVELLMKLVTEPAVPLASVAPAIPAPICAVVDRALAFERNARYPDAAAMQADVRAAMRGEMPVVVEAPPTVAPQKIAPVVTKEPTAVTMAAPVAVAAPAAAAAPAAVAAAVAAPASVPASVPQPTVIRAGEPATFVAAASPADLRASVPSVRHPAPAPVEARAVPARRTEILGMPLLYVLLGGAGIALVGLIAIVGIAMLFFRTTPPSADPSTVVATATSPTPTSTPTQTPTPTPTQTPTQTPSSHGKSGNPHKK
jgi:serine/threonine-protein kinase